MRRFESIPGPPRSLQEGPYFPRVRARRGVSETGRHPNSAASSPIPLPVSGRVFPMSEARRVVAKVEWNPGELYPRVGFIVTNMSRPAESVVAFYTSAARVNNGSRKARARSDGPGFPAAHSPPKRCGFGFMRSLTISATSCARWRRPNRLKEKLIKIGAKIVSHGRYVASRWPRSRFRRTSSPTSCE